MSLPPNLEVLLASPAKTIHPLVADDPLDHVVDTDVVSPHSTVNQNAATIVNQPPSICSTKIVLKNDLISDDPTKHSSSGHDVMLIFLKILESKGYDACMGHGKKTPFIEKINAQLHADDGPLVRYKKTSDSSFLKKITKALKVLD